MPIPRSIGSTPDRSPPISNRPFRGQQSTARSIAPGYPPSCSASLNDFKKLEAIVHPRIRDGERAFLQAEHARDALMAVLEVPLLFEAGGYKAVDVKIVVSANSDIQRQRVLPRPE